MESCDIFFLFKSEKERSGSSESNLFNFKTVYFLMCGDDIMLLKNTIFAQWLIYKF